MLTLRSGSYPNSPPLICLRLARGPYKYLLNTLNFLNLLNLLKSSLLNLILLDFGLLSVFNLSFNLTNFINLINLNIILLNFLINLSSTSSPRMMAKIQRQSHRSAILTSLRIIFGFPDLVNFIITLLLLDLFYVHRAIVKIQKQFCKFLKDLRPLSEFIAFWRLRERHLREDEVFEHFRINYVACFVVLGVCGLVEAKPGLFLIAILLVLVLSLGRAKSIPVLLLMSLPLCLIIAPERFEIACIMNIYILGSIRFTATKPQATRTHE